MPHLTEQSGLLELIGKLVFLALALLFFVVVVVFTFHLYANRFLNIQQETSISRRRRHHHIRNVSAFSPGLDPSVLNKIPVIIFVPTESREELECSVCLSDISKGEKARLLPKCNHGFHLECIDMWFQSHSTCPLCRNPVSDQNQSISVAESMTDEVPTPDNSGIGASPRFPTNVLIWGNQSQVSTLGPCTEESHVAAAPSSSSLLAQRTSVLPERILVIDVPRLMNEDEEPKSPMPSKMRSLKRLLSGNRRAYPSSPRNVDLEVGE